MWGWESTQGKKKKRKKKKQKKKIKKRKKKKKKRSESEACDPWKIASSLSINSFSSSSSFSIFILSSCYFLSGQDFVLHSLHNESHGIESWETQANGNMDFGSFSSSVEDSAEFDKDLTLSEKLKVFKPSNFDPEGYVTSRCRRMGEKVTPPTFFLSTCILAWILYHLYIYTRNLLMYYYDFLRMMGLSH